MRRLYFCALVLGFVGFFGNRINACNVAEIAGGPMKMFREEFDQYQAAYSDLCASTTFTRAARAAGINDARIANHARIAHADHRELDRREINNLR